MEDVRLTATNPADSSIVPVACNDKGELLLEEPIAGPPGEDGEDGAPGLQGPAGPQGPQGEKGEDGKDGRDGKDGEDGKDGKDGVIDLPPDPYEGALLGWLNGGLAWVGTPPIEIPPGVYGPITNWDPQSGYLELDGEIPSLVTGAYIYQCNIDGTYFTNGLNVEETWSNYGSGPVFDANDGWTNVFDYDSSTRAVSTEYSAITWDGGIQRGNNASIAIARQSAANIVLTVNGSTTDSNGNEWAEMIPPNNQISTVNIGSGLTSFSLWRNGGSGSGAYLYRVSIDGKELVDKNKSLNLRVNNTLPQGIVGVPNLQDIAFTEGKYIYVPQQRIAPWVASKSGMSPPIDYLRSKGD